MDGDEFDHHMAHPNQVIKVHLGDLIPYAMHKHDPFVEDFIWFMDDNRHAEPISKELTQTDVPRLIFAERETILAARASSSSGATEVAGRDSSRAAHYSTQEIKRNSQGLRRDELSSSEVLDITIFNLGNLARQTIQHEAEPRMLRLIMNQTSHINDVLLRARLSLLISGTKGECSQLESLQLR